MTDFMDSFPDRALTRLAWLRKVLDDPHATLASASADASFRSYWRTSHKGQSWIVMDSPPAQEDPAPWLEIGARLSAAGLHVPEVREHDLEQGFLLIEDLGDRLYLPALTAASVAASTDTTLAASTDTTVDALYAYAMDALLRMQRDVETTGLPAYDHAFLQRELEIMPEWFLRTHLGHTPECGEWDVLESAFTVLLKSALEQPRCFVHRDYHSRNLLIVADNNPGIIDFQGAVLGPITYDLASLLRDCYITWDRERVEAWVESYRLRLQEAHLIDRAIDHERFLRWFDLIGLQRHVKVLGIFCRLYYRDGKQGYLADLPRVYNYVIDVAERYPELADFAALLRHYAGERDLRQAVAA